MRPDDCLAPITKRAPAASEWLLSLHCCLSVPQSRLKAALSRSGEPPLNAVAFITSHSTAIARTTSAPPRPGIRKVMAANLQEVDDPSTQVTVEYEINTALCAFQDHGLQRQIHLICKAGKTLIGGPSF
jgi:hypothetical protein